MTSETTAGRTCTQGPVVGQDPGRGAAGGSGG
jgi:hypothetical protein